MYVDALPFCLMFPQIERRFCIKWSTRSSCNGPCSTFYSSYSILNNAASHHTVVSGVHTTRSLRRKAKVPSTCRTHALYSW